MQASRGLTDLPSELRQEIFFWTIATAGPEAHLQLLLTNSAVNESTHAVSDSGAIEYGTNQYGHLAVTLLAPVPGQDLINQWLPHLRSVVSSINILLDYCQEKLDPLSHLAEQQGITAISDLSQSDVTECIRTLKLGLYLTEAIRFQGQPSATDVRAFLHSVSTNGLLILHLTSILLTCCMHKKIIRDIGTEDLAIAVRRDDLLIVQATHTELLSLGSQTLSAMVTPDVPSSEYLPAEAYDTLDRAHLIVAHQKRCDKVEEENDNRQYARQQAAKKFLKTLQLTLAYQSFPPGPFQDCQKAVIITRRIKESFGGSVPFRSAKIEDVRHMQALVLTELGDKSALKIMKDFETAINLCRV